MEETYPTSIHQNETVLGPICFSKEDIAELLSPREPHHGYSQVLSAALEPGKSLEVSGFSHTIKPSLTQSRMVSRSDLEAIARAHLPNIETASEEGVRREKRKQIPLGINEEEMDRMVKKYLASASIESQRQWMGAQLRDRASACAPDVKRPFRNLRDAWNALHVYHVFHRPSPSPFEEKEFQHQISSTLSEFSKWREHADNFFDSAVKAECKKVPCEEALLLARLQCSDENEKMQVLRADVRRREEEIKEMLNPTIEEAEEEEEPVQRSRRGNTRNYAEDDDDDELDDPDDDDYD